jgi:hypothetical protein
MILRTPERIAKLRQEERSPAAPASRTTISASFSTMVRSERHTAPLPLSAALQR